MTKKRRVVVTGMGLASCFGTDVNDFYNALLAGQSGIGLIDSFDCSEYPTRIAGCIRDFDTGEYLDKKQTRRVDPFIRYAVVAGKKAVESAGFDLSNLESLEKHRCGIIVASGMGGMSVFYEGTKTIISKGYKRLTPFFVPFIITNMAGAFLAIDLGFKGPNYSISTACATSNFAMLAAAQHIQRGDADLMLCGGAEAAINTIGLAGFVACRAISERNDEPTKASRPWDKNRDGFVMGEGAGVLVLESLEHALKRGAPILAEYLGGGLSCDAHHITEPSPDGSGVLLCMDNAIKDAGIPKEQVNYINAHATSTVVGDMCEIRAIKSYFGEHAATLKINATKSMIGHCLGAASSIESIAILKAIETGKLHPTINLDDPEPELEGLNVVPHIAQECVVTAAMSNSFGFGGHNSTLIFAPYKE
jgi:3-oxoacyl-[acyl-carrier-protein] synthase II